MSVNWKTVTVLHLHCRLIFLNRLSSRARSPEEGCFRVPPPPTMSQLPDFDEETQEQNSCSLLADTVETPALSTVHETHDADISLKSGTTGALKSCDTKSVNESKEKSDRCVSSTSVDFNNDNSCLDVTDMNMSVQSGSILTAVSAVVSTGISAAPSQGTANKGTKFPARYGTFTHRDIAIK